MRRVINKIDNTKIITPADCDQSKIYVACGVGPQDGIQWILRFEPREENTNNYGWIFRYWDCTGGMSGWHFTIQSAIKSAFEFGEVFEFDTFEEAATFLVK